MDILTSLYFWLVLGCYFLLLEGMSGTGYLTAASLSAFFISFVIYLAPETNIWFIMLLFMSVLSALVFIFYKFDKIRVNTTKETFNQKDLELIGCKGTVIEDAQGDYSRMQLADSSWRIYSETPLKIGDIVTVIGVNGSTLKVEKTNH